MKHFTFFILCASVLFAACGTKQKNAPQTDERAYQLADYENRLADSILQCGLDNEALYTLLGGIKPMSSLVTFTFPIANDDSTKTIGGNILNRAAHGAALDRIQTITKAMNRLNITDLKFIITPYQTPSGNKRIIQLSVVRVSMLDSLLNVKENFFGQFGFVPGADPNVVVGVIECSNRFERWRGYGYLFGYPDYAVDFYNNAALEFEKTGKFVERNFFRIPTYTSENGNFVYAYPKNRIPAKDTDSAIYDKAAHILNEYKNIRNNYLNADSTLQAYRLLLDFHGTNER